jgi:hypothetical protein
MTIQPIRLVPLLASLACLAASPGTQTHLSAEAASTPEGLIRALYDMVSFDAGPEPDWEMFREVFLDDAVLVFSPSRAQPMRVMGVDGFIQDWRDFFRDAELAGKGFHETIAGLEVTEFGGLAHAFVIFEPRIGTEPPPRQIRGLDSIELCYDGERWWVAAITTEFEGPGKTIPEGIGG